MSDVPVRCIYTYFKEPSSDYHAQVEIEMHFEPRGSDSWRILVAPASLCIGRHRVCWTLVDSPVELEYFELMEEVPGKVRMVEWPPKQDRATKQWSAVIENMGVMGNNGFRYGFHFKRPGHPNKQFNSHDFMHDPTISVTPDPLEPPYTR